MICIQVVYGSASSDVLKAAKGLEQDTVVCPAAMPSCHVEQEDANHITLLDRCAN